MFHNPVAVHVCAICIYLNSVLTAFDYHTVVKLNVCLYAVFSVGDYVNKCCKSRVVYLIVVSISNFVFLHFLIIIAVCPV